MKGQEVVSPIRLVEKSKMLTFFGASVTMCLVFRSTFSPVTTGKAVMAESGATQGRTYGANGANYTLISYQDLTGVGRLKREYGCKILPGFIYVF